MLNTMHYKIENSVPNKSLDGRLKNKVAIVTASTDGYDQLLRLLMQMLTLNF